MSAVWTPRLPCAAAIHESAHVTIATLLGFPVNRVVVGDEGEGYTNVTLPLPAQALRTADADGYFPWAVAILRAGVAAEQCLLGTAQQGAGQADEEVISMWIETYSRPYGARWVRENLGAGDSMVEHMLSAGEVRETITRMARVLVSRNGILTGGDITREMRNLLSSYEARVQAELGRVYS